jgi:hypothetical protein
MNGDASRNRFFDGAPAGMIDPRLQRPKEKASASPQELRVQIPIHASAGLGYGQIVICRENSKRVQYRDQIHL